MDTDKTEYQRLIEAEIQATLQELTDYLVEYGISEERARELLGLEIKNPDLLGVFFETMFYVA